MTIVTLYSAVNLSDETTGSCWTITVDSDPFFTSTDGFLIAYTQFISPFISSLFRAQSHHTCLRN